MKYQIGRAERPEATDKWCETKEAAIHNAHVAAAGDYVFAVWEWIDADHAEVVCLVYNGDVYFK